MKFALLFAVSVSVPAELKVSAPSISALIVAPKAPLVKVIDPATLSASGPLIVTPSAPKLSAVGFTVVPPLLIAIVSPVPVKVTSSAPLVKVSPLATPLSQLPVAVSQSPLPPVDAPAGSPAGFQVSESASAGPDSSVTRIVVDRNCARLDDPRAAPD